MIIEEGIRTYLLAASAINAIVGQQIYGIVRPQGVRPLPEILLFRTTSTRQVLFCGTNPLVDSDFQIDAYAEDVASCMTLAQALRKTLVDYSGQMGACYVDQVNLINEFPVTDSDPGIIRMVQLYKFWYVED